MIDHAVYDGTNVTVSYAIETNHELGEEIHGGGWFDVIGAIGMGGSDQISKVSDTRYVGLSTFTPDFKDGVYPETVEVTWAPKAFYSISNDVEVKGDWSFAFSLQRVEGDIRIVNETIQHTDVHFTLKTIEFTDVSTVIAYEQVVSDELLAKWPSVTPMFHVSDDLGHVYVDGTSGGGVLHDNGKTFEGTTTFGTIQEGARQLIIRPIEIASKMSGQGYVEIELETIVIELEK